MNLALGVALLGSAVRVVDSIRDPVVEILPLAARLDTQLLKVGSAVDLAALGSAGAGLDRRTIVIAARSTCASSRASVGLYKELISRSAETPEWQLLLLLDDEDKAGRQWLVDEGLGTVPFIEVDFTRIGIWGTPSLFLADPLGVVTDNVVGSLSAQGEARLWKRLDNPLAGEPLDNVLAPTVIDNAELTRRLMTSPATIVVDTRMTTSFAKEHRPDAINIPLNELGRAADTTLPRDRTVVLDCNLQSAASCHYSAMLLTNLGYADVLVLRSRPLFSPERAHQVY